jgi:hypothetical protein
MVLINLILGSSKPLRGLKITLPRYDIFGYECDNGQIIHHDTVFLPSSQVIPLCTAHRCSELAPHNAKPSFLYDADMADSLKDLTFCRLINDLLGRHRNSQIN